MQRLIHASSWDARTPRREGDRVHADGKNLATRRELLLRFPFDEARPRGEDLQWSMLMAREGMATVYWPDMHVDHEDQPGLGDYLARKVSDAWTGRHLVVTRPELAWSRHPGRAGRALARAIAALPGSAAAGRATARLVVRSGEALGNHGGRLPFPVALGLMRGLRAGVRLSAMLLHDAGEPQPAADAFVSRPR